MEMERELEEMISKYSKFEQDFMIAEFIEELMEIKDSINFASKG